MRICTNCKIEADDNTKFCPYCGTLMSEKQPVYEAQPVQIYQIQKPHLGLKISSMVLSITGFSCLVLGFFYTLIGLVEEGVALGMAIAFALFFLPLCIVGFALSKKCINQGDTSAFSRVGKGLGLAGIIISAVSLFIGFISVMGY